MKKFISSLTSLCMSVSLTAGALSAFSTSAAVDGVEIQKTLKFLAGDEKAANYTISAEEIAAGDVTITVGMYLEETVADTGSITARWQLGECADSSAIKMSNLVDLCTAQTEETTYTIKNADFPNGKEVTTTNRLFFSGTVKRSGEYTPVGSCAASAMEITDSYGYIIWLGAQKTPWLGETSDAYPVTEFDVTIAQNAAPGEYHIDFESRNSDAAEAAGKQQSTTQIGYNDTSRTGGLDDLFMGGLGLEGITITVEGEATTTASTEESTTTTTTTTASDEETTTTTTTTTTGDSGEVEVGEGLSWKVDDVVVSREDLEADNYIYVPVYVAGDTNGQEVAGAGLSVEFPDTFIWHGEEASVKNYAYNNVNCMFNETEPKFSWTSERSLDDGTVVGTAASEVGAKICQLCIEVPVDTPDGTYPIELVLKQYDGTSDVIVADAKNTPVDVTFLAGSITIGEPTSTETTTSATTTESTETTTTTTTAPPTADPSGRLAGDANVDGKVNIADVVTVNQYVVDSEKYALTEQGAINANVGYDDVAADDAVTAADATAIIKSIVKLVTLK